MASRDGANDARMRSCRGMDNDGDVGGMGGVVGESGFKDGRVDFWRSFGDWTRRMDDEELELHGLRGRGRYGIGSRARDWGLGHQYGSSGSRRTMALES